MGRTYPILLKHGVTCPFYGYGTPPAEGFPAKHLGDFCSQCPYSRAGEDCDEITCAVWIIDQITDLTLLPLFLSSRFELVRKLAINKLGELLREE